MTTCVRCGQPAAFIVSGTDWSLTVCRAEVVAALDCYLTDPPGGFERLSSITVAGISEKVLTTQG